MPARPSKACKVLGCPATSPCPIHGRAAERAAYERVRGTSTARGYDADWQGFVERYFGILWDLKVPRAGQCGCRHPTAPITTDSECARLGTPKLAALVDHIEPLRGRTDPRRFDLANLQGLCHPCHNRKRQRESTRARRA